MSILSWIILFVILQAIIVWSVYLMSVSGQLGAYHITLICIIILLELFIIIIIILK